MWLGKMMIHSNSLVIVAGGTLHVDFSFLKMFKEMMLQVDNSKGDLQDAKSEEYTVFDLEITC